MENRPICTFRSQQVQYALLGGSLLLLLIVLCWLTFSGERSLSPGRLAQLALSDASEDEREAAALRLARHPDRAVELLRRVFAESKSGRVRAAAALGLGTLHDWKSGPALIQALEDRSPLLRGRAAQALNQIAHEDFHFYPRDPEKRRQEAIDLIKRKWPVLHEGHLAKQRRKRGARG
jgi:hypothetical protein